MIISNLSEFVAHYGHSELNNGDVDQTLFATPINDEGEVVMIPAFKKMKQQPPIEIEVFDSWTDDHAPCFGISVKFENDDETYLFALWWTDPTFLLILGQTVNNLEKSNQFVDQFFTED